MADARAGSSVELRTALVDLATRLEGDARWHGDDVSWPTPRAEPDAAAADGWGWCVDQQAPPWLYDGLAGIARATALAAPVVRQTAPSLAGRLEQTSAAAIRGALEAASAAGPAGRWGLYDGSMGVACVAVELGRLWHQSALVEEGLRLARRSCESADTGTDALDLISGRAGLVCGAAWVTGWTRGAPAALDVRDLVSPELSDPPDHLGPGLAHGLAGVAVALAHAWRHSNDPALLTRIAAVNARENETFVPDAGGWPDARDGSHVPCWWCHGAVGIGFARQRVTALTGVPSGGVAVARAAVLRALTDGGLSHADWSLCHGMGGAVAFLLTGPSGPDAPADRGLALQLLAEGVASARHAGRWPGGAPLDVPQSGLMTGHAGVLLLLVRAACGESATRWPLWL